MKAWKFTAAQVTFVLKQAERGIPVAEVRWKAGIFPLIDKVRPDLEDQRQFQLTDPPAGFRS